MPLPRIRPHQIFFAVMLVVIACLLVYVVPEIEPSKCTSVDAAVTTRSKGKVFRLLRGAKNGNNASLNSAAISSKSNDDDSESASVSVDEVDVGGRSSQRNTAIAASVGVVKKRREAASDNKPSTVKVKVKNIRSFGDNINTGRQCLVTLCLVCVLGFCGYMFYWLATCDLGEYLDPLTPDIPDTGDLEDAVDSLKDAVDSLEDTVDSVTGAAVDSVDGAVNSLWDRVTGETSGGPPAASTALQQTAAGPPAASDTLQLTV